MWRRLRAKDGFEPASALGYLAEVLLHQGKLEDSEIQRRAEFEMLRRLYGTTNVSVVRSLSFLADVLQREGKLEEAEARAREALELCRSPSPAGSGSVVKRTEPIEALLSILLVQHREVEAEQLLNDCLKPTLDGQLQLLQVFLLRARSSFFARSRRWTEAIKDLRKVTELDRLDHEAAFQLTVLLLESGDRENCRAQCQKMAASFRGANAPGPLGKTAEACLLSAEAGADAESAGQLADQAFALGKNSYRVYHLQFVKGLAEYRAGHFASAVEWMGKSIGQPTMVFGPRPDGPAYLVQAMAQHQLKRSDEARVALTKGAEIVQAKLLNLPNAALDENWVDWLIAHILLREAQGLIEGQIDAPSHPPKTN